MKASEKPAGGRTSGIKLGYLLLATVLLFIAAGALTLWLPHSHQRAIVADLRDRGAIVTTQPGGPTWMREYIDTENLAVFDEVVAVDMLKARATDDDMDLLQKFPKLQALTLYGPELTDAGVSRLRHLTGLRNLLLVNCPHVSEQAIADLRAAGSFLRVDRRGSALLGIAGANQPGGCLVILVVRGGAADLAGLRAGDKIVALDGAPVTGYDTFTEQLAAHKPGEKIRLSIAGDGATPRMVDVTLGSWQ